MNINNKLMYLDNMAFSDMSAFLSMSEIKSYLELRHKTKRTAYETDRKNEVLNEEM